MREAILVLLLFGVMLACGAEPMLQKLGSYNYQTDESSPLWFGGRIVIMEVGT